MECLNTIFPVILYILGSILLIVLIMLCFKIMSTLKKVDQVVDDVNVKVGKLDGIFNIIDRSTDAISTVSDKVIDFISGAISKLFLRKRNKKEEKDYEEE